MKLEDVQPGDKLIAGRMRGASASTRIVVVTRLTATRIVCGSDQFHFNGAGWNVAATVRVPRRGEIARLEKAQAKLKRQREAAQAEDDARRARPEYQVAARLCSRSEEELIDLLGAEHLLQIGKWMATKQTRQLDGRYDYDNMDRLCKCGHTLGEHFATTRACAVGTDDDREPCTCVKFMPAKNQPK